MDIYDIYELMIIPPNKKGEMIVSEIKKRDKANLNLVRDLITLGANLDWQDDYGLTALHWCTRSNQPEIARMLIDAGADLNIQRNDGMSVLHWSILHYNTWNSNPNTWNRIYPEIPMMLIEAEADVNIQDGGGWTALHMCAFFHFPDIVRMLINAGADKTIQDNKGRFPHELAESKELQELLKV